MNIFRLVSHFAYMVAVAVIIVAFNVQPAHSQTIDALDATFKDWMAKNGVTRGVLAVTRYQIRPRLLHIK